MSKPDINATAFSSSEPLIDEGDLARFYREWGKDLSAAFARHENGDYEVDLEELVTTVRDQIQRLTTAMKAIDMVARAAGKHAPIAPADRSQKDERKQTVSRVRAYWKLKCLLGNMEDAKTAARASQVVDAIAAKGARWEQAKVDLAEISKRIGEAKRASQQAELQSAFASATRRYNAATMALRKLLTPQYEEAVAQAKTADSAEAIDLFNPGHDYVSEWQDRRKGLAPTTSGRATPRGDRIRELRKAKSWSQQRLSDETAKFKPNGVGLGVRTIRRVEAGRDVNLRTLSYVAAALQEELTSIIRTDDPTSGTPNEPDSASTSRPDNRRSPVMRRWRLQPS